MSEVFRERGCDVEPALIEFTDPRYAERFREFPMPHPYRELFGMILPVARDVTGEIRVPDVVERGRVRPGVHRLADVVALDQRADPLVPGVRTRPPRCSTAVPSPPSSPAGATGATTSTR